MTRVGELSTNELVRRYRDAAQTHGGGEMGSNTRNANRSADQIAAVYRELRTRGEETVLLVLLNDPDPAVRSWAASHALEFSPSEGEPVLEALVAGDHPPLVGFTAEATLREWRAGKLRFP